MDTSLSLEYAHDEPLPPGHDSEFRTPNALVERFLRAYSERGDRVLDPFAGFGTTLTVAQRLDRVPYGIEYEPDRVEYVRDRLADPGNVRQGDVRNLEPSWVPDCEVVFTSPPFMERTDDRNPFENYAGESSYDAYLDDIETAFSRVDRVLAPGARVVVDVANIKFEDRVTTLAWDVADRVANVFHFEGEVVVTWEESGGDAGDRSVSPDEDTGDDGTFGYGYDHSYCHVFRTPEG